MLLVSRVQVNVTAVFTPKQTEEVLSAIGDNQTPSIISIFAGRIADSGKNALNITKFDQDNMWKPTSNTKYKYKVEEVELISSKLLFVHIDRLTYDINANTIVKLETNIKPVIALVFITNRLLK